MPSSIPPLVESYLQYCKIAKDCETTRDLDLQDLTWVFPTCLLPIFGRLKREGVDYTPPANSSVAKYLSIMESNQNSPPTTAVPVISLPPGDRENKIANTGIRTITNDGKVCGGKQATAYFIDELVNNIYDHSKFQHAYFMAQRYNRKQFTEIGFFDDGISIPGSYKEYGMQFNDVESVKAALDGVSSKKGYERGYGLCTSIRLLKDGLNADILVVSKTAAFHITAGLIEAYDLRHCGSLDGTLVSARIPFTSKDVDIYDYIGGSD